MKIQGADEVLKHRKAYIYFWIDPFLRYVAALVKTIRNHENDTTGALILCNSYKDNLKIFIFFLFLSRVPRLL